MIFDDTKLAKRIKEIRLGKGLTQETLCEQIDIEPPNYSKIETNKSVPSLKTLCKLASVLGVTPNDFFEYDHFSNEKKLDEMNMKIYNSFSLRKKQSLYKILRALEDFN